MQDNINKSPFSTKQILKAAHILTYVRPWINSSMITKWILLLYSLVKNIKASTSAVTDYEMSRCCFPTTFFFLECSQSVQEWHPVKVAPEPLETTFHLNIIYLTFKFLKPVQKAMCGKECQSQHPTVNLSREHTQCNKSPEQQTAQLLYIINNVSIKSLHQSYLLQHVKFSLCVMQRLSNMCDCCHAMIQSVVCMYKKV